MVISYDPITINLPLIIQNRKKIVIIFFMVTFAGKIVHFTLNFLRYDDYKAKVLKYRS